MIDRPGNQPRVVSLQDVATRAGVSRATASRALSGARRVGADIVARVQLAAQDLGYHPNQAARNLRLSRTMTFGAVFSRLVNPQMLDFVEGVSREGQEYGYSLVTMTSRGDPDLYKSLVQQLFERRVDALFAILPPDLGQTLQPYLAAGIPVVTVFGQESNARYAPLVTIDEDAAILQAVHRLADLGHRTILYLCTPAGANSTRVPAFQAAARACDVSLVIGTVSDSASSDAVATVLQQYVRRRPHATAIFADVPLVSKFCRALSKLDLQMPADISFVAFGGASWLEELDLGWATIRSDLQEAGQAAVRVIFDWLAGTPPPAITMVGTAQWVERGSIGPVCVLSRLRAVKKA